MTRSATFPVNDRLRAMIDHVKNATSIRPCLSDLLDPDILKPGIQPSLDNDVDDIDPSKVPVGLWLVKDDGIYLMSPGLPILYNPNKLGSSLTLQALETDPALVGNDSWDVARQIAGGDDFVEKLGIDWFDQVLTSGASAFSITFTDSAFELVLHHSN